MTGTDRRWRLAVTITFFANGATFSSWLPRIPEVRERLGLDLDELGLVLLGGGLGGLLASAVGGVAVDRLGSRRASIGAALALSAGLPAIGLAPSGIVLALVLVALGMVDVVADIGMNLQAAAVQRRSSRSVVQRFHASWSVGTVVGALCGTGAAALGVPLTTQLAVTAVALATAVLVAGGHLSPVDDRPAPARDAGGRGPVLALLAGVALVVAVVEGAPGEWAAVFGRDVHGAGPGVAGLGYLAVSAGMVVGRIGGDGLTDRVGAGRVLRLAVCAVGVGLGVVVASSGMVVAVVGFAVVGLGVSVLFPALYLRAADTPGLAGGLGVGVMSTGARIGFLASPVAVGTLAASTSLRVALGVVVGVAGGAAVVLDAALSRRSPR